MYNPILSNAITVVAVLFGFRSSVGCVHKPKPGIKVDTGSTGTIVPLYLYPEEQSGVHNWQPLIDACAAYPIEVWAIVNVNSGPSNEVDTNYKNAIQRLKSAGIRTLGYVSTNYTRRSAIIVQEEVDKWKTFYNPEGIFFDEMTADNDKAHLSYYLNLGKYAKNEGYTFTVGNPGTDVVPQYVGILDTIMIVEDGTGFPNENKTCGWHLKYPRRQWGIFPYNIPALNETQILSTKPCVGFIYVTHDGGNNPWDELPPYLSQLFEMLKKPLK